MPEWTEAERYLLEQIRLGNQEAWSQLVERYQGRLVAFARRRAPRGTDPEDLVQDTFLLFLRGLANYRGQASVETYLFLILRRRIIELLRLKRLSACQLPESSDSHEAGGGPTAAAAAAAAAALVAPDATASWYARREEQRDAAHAALASALRTLVASLQADVNFRELQILELLFYAQRPNREIAAKLGVGAEHVAMVKHRWLKQVRERVAPLLRSTKKAGGGADDDDDEAPVVEALDSLLTETWEDERPSCPKRSTIGGYLLRSLDEPWQAYVAFHLDAVGCSFCRANLEDLQKQTAQDPRTLRHRILQSTVGFFRKS